MNEEVQQSKSKIYNLLTFQYQLNINSVHYEWFLNVKENFSYFSLSSLLVV